MIRNGLNPKLAAKQRRQELPRCIAVYIIMPLAFGPPDSGIQLS